MPESRITISWAIFSWGVRVLKTLSTHWSAASEEVLVADCAGLLMIGAIKASRKMKFLISA